MQLLLMAERGGLSVRTPVNQVVDATRRVSAAHDGSRYVITGDFAVLSKNPVFEDSSQSRAHRLSDIESSTLFTFLLGYCQKEPVRPFDNPQTADRNTVV
jgi:hypothetical protein